MQDDFLDASTSQPRTDNVTDLMHSLHPQPTGEKRRNDQQGLFPAVRHLAHLVSKEPDKSGYYERTSVLLLKIRLTHSGHAFQGRFYSTCRIDQARIGENMCRRVAQVVPEDSGDG